MSRRRSPRSLQGWQVKRGGEIVVHGAVIGSEPSGRFDEVDLARMVSDSAIDPEALMVGDTIGDGIHGGRI